MYQLEARTQVRFRSQGYVLRKPFDRVQRALHCHLHTAAPFTYFTLEYAETLQVTALSVACETRYLFRNMV